jgi:hypothetical protein
VEQQVLETSMEDQTHKMMHQTVVWVEPVETVAGMFFYLF